MKVPSVNSVIDAIEKMRSTLVFSVEKKVTGFVLGKLPHRGALLPELSSPRFLWQMLLPFCAKKEERKSGRGKKMLAPIGLPICPMHPWINAWIQFLIHLPKFSDIVIFAFSPFLRFSEFIDQYRYDQQEGRCICRVSAFTLVQGFPEILSSDGKSANLREGILLLFSQMFSPMPQRINSIVFHPEWVIVWRGEGEILSFVKKRVQTAPEEILLSIEAPSSSVAPRQVFHQKYVYDLDAFIERRSDTTFVTYVQSEGIWYQCDNEKIREIPSRILSVPLSRGILFHYQKQMWGGCPRI